MVGAVAALDESVGDALGDVLAAPLGVGEELAEWAPTGFGFAGSSEQPAATTATTHSPAVSAEPFPVTATTPCQQTPRKQPIPSDIPDTLPGT